MRERHDVCCERTAKEFITDRYQEGLTTSTLESVTGEIYVEIAWDNGEILIGVDLERPAIIANNGLAAWQLFTEVILRYMEDKPSSTHKVYFRVEPEFVCMPDGRYRVYCRLLISDKPASVS